MANLKIEIISPTGVVFKGECNIAVVPSVEGDLGVMYGHEAVIANLREGQITLFDDKQTVLKSIDVSSGFAEIQQGGEKLLVLID